MRPVRVDAFARLPRPIRRLALTAVAVVALARTATGALLRADGTARRMALEAVVLLALARAFVSYVPMRRWRRHLNTEPSGEGHDGVAEAEAERALGREVGRIVRKVASCMPFHAVCLPQAMAAQWMLRRRGISSRLIFGVRRARQAPGGASPWGREGADAGADRRGAAVEAGRRGDGPAGLDFHAWLAVAGENVVGGAGSETYAPLPEVTPWPERGGGAQDPRAAARRRTPLDAR